MTKTGRPKVPGESIYVRLDPTVAEKLNEYIAERKQSPGTVSKNSVINYALKKFFADLQKE